MQGVASVTNLYYNIEILATELKLVSIIRTGHEVAVSPSLRNARIRVISSTPFFAGFGASIASATSGLRFRRRRLRVAEENRRYWLGRAKRFLSNVHIFLATQLQ